MGAELHMEHYRGVLKIENCCAVFQEKDSGTLQTKKMSGLLRVYTLMSCI